MSIVNNLLYFLKSLFITIKFRVFDFDSKLQNKYSSQIRILIWIAIAAVICLILYFLLGYIGDLLLQVTNFSPQPETGL